MRERWNVRPARDDEVPRIAEVLDIAFHGHSTAERIEELRERLELDRTLIALDGDRIVGTSSAWGWTVTVPGGELPVAAITIVTVLPTHRRQGILRAMMDAQTALARDRGEPLAALGASEATIYGRFGFGVASWEKQTRFDLRRSVGLRGPVGEHELQLLSPDEAAPLLPAIFERARGRRGGTMSRTPAWWLRVLHDTDEERGSDGVKRVVTAGDDGYAIYRSTGDPIGNTARVVVKELVAATAEAERALLRFLSQIDLATELRLVSRPVDDPLELAIDDTRAVSTLLAEDALWLRLLDLPAAVAGRSWADDVDLVLDVEHPGDDAVAGRWALRAGPAGGTCARTDRAGDLRLHARELGSLYLGGVRATTLRDAGLVEERTPGAAVALDRALWVERAPWAVDHF